jgi:cobalamin-dependent methionine synthase I
MTNSARAAQFAEPGQGLVFGQRVLVADGAMGTMLQASDVSLDDFDGHEGCNEVLNVTRPDVFRARGPGQPDVVAFQLVTVGSAVSEATAALFAKDAYRDYLDGILKVGYRGCRYSFGYPACPDLEDRAKVVQLLAPERIGVTLTEEFQLVPEQSTDALIAFHPEARYFSA